MEGYQTLLILFIVYLAGFLLYQTLRVRNKKSNSLWYCIGIFISTVIYQLHLPGEMRVIVSLYLRKREQILWTERVLNEDTARYFSVLHISAGYIYKYVHGKYSLSGKSMVDWHSISVDGRKTLEHLIFDMK
ncbi:hypothetical protein ES796_23290 [Salmonella enterica]|nr:hypothetical protein [Salmonella enterica]EBW1593868.1 hypothetical protein [Salmonella enterica subsp. diarizonae serovar 61:r:z]